MTARRRSLSVQASFGEFDSFIGLLALVVPSFQRARKRRDTDFAAVTELGCILGYDIMNVFCATFRQLDGASLALHAIGAQR